MSLATPSRVSKKSPTIAQKQWRDAESKAKREHLERIMSDELMRYDGHNDLLDSELPLFLHQFPVTYQGDDGKDHKYFIDFADPVGMIAIECNGGTWSEKSGHSGGMAIRKDYQRMRRLAMAGWLVLPFTSDEIEHGTAIALVSEIYRRRFKPS